MALNRGALDLLTTYGEDSSDDDVPACRVSTKRTHVSSDEESEINNKRLLSRLPLPDIINIEKEHVEDDPAQHGGRIRSFPHERGNWATYAYISYQMPEDMKELIHFIKRFMCNFDIQAVDDFHISLTKVVILRHHWIESFIKSVKNKVMAIKCFMIFFDSLKVFCNEERTRTFIGLSIRSGFDSLLKLVCCLDSCLDEFKLPGFYKDPSFHMSVAWCIGDHEDIINGILPELNREVWEFMNNSSQDSWYIYVDQLECKVGNKLFTFKLS